MRSRIQLPVQHPHRCRELLAVMVGAFPPTSREQRIADALDRLPDAEMIATSLVSAEIPIADCAAMLGLSVRRIQQLVQNTKRILAANDLEAAA